MKPGERGLPKTGARARTLGARANIDIPVNEDETVDPEMEGMSVSPPPENLPPLRAVAAAFVEAQGKRAEIDAATSLE
jgi:hypothetical protein